jgi:hypothetical protein
MIEYKLTHVQGLYFDMTHNSVIKNTNITISAASDFSYGIYNLNDSDNDFYNVNIDVNYVDKYLTPLAQDQDTSHFIL